MEHTFLLVADRAKSIKTSAQVNQTATDKMIKELIAEKERLLKELQSAKSGQQAGLSDEEMMALKEEQEKEVRFALFFPVIFWLINIF